MYFSNVMNLVCAQIKKRQLVLDTINFKIETRKLLIVHIQFAVILICRIAFYFLPACSRL